MKTPDNPGHWIAAAIFAVLACVFIHSPVTYIGDSKYSLLLSESLLSKGSFVLDGYAIPRNPARKTGDAEVDGDIYQIEVANGHFYYYFPPGSSILSIPFVAVMDYLGRPIVGKDGVYSFGNETKVQAKLAALLMALLGAGFYYTTRLVLPAAWSAGLALGAALGTQIWSTASRAVWTHTWGVFLLGWIVYLLLANETGRRKLNPVLLASLLSWAYFVRPTNSLFILGVTVYVVLYARAVFVPYALTGAVWFAGFAGWSWWQFGRVLPSYYRASRLDFTHFLEAFAGNLVSPSRGLLVLVPVTLFVLYLAVRYWRELAHRRLLAVLLAVGAGHLVVVASFSPWNGGTCFGPRYTTELVPVLLLATVLGVAAMRRRHEAAVAGGSEWKISLVAGGVLLVTSVLINARGANALSTVKWNILPASIDVVPARVWDWSYPQALAGIIPMPQPAVLPKMPAHLAFGTGAAGAFQGDGWAPGETDFCWTEEPAATVFFATDQTDSGYLQIRLVPFIAPEKGLRQQRVRIDLNGRRLASFTMTDKLVAKYTFPLPAGILRPRNLLTFQLPDAVSPRSIGLNSNPQRLGIAVYWLEWGTAAEAKPPTSVPAP